MAKHEQEACERLGAKVLTLPGVIAQSGAIVSHAHQALRANAEAAAAPAGAGVGCPYPHLSGVGCHNPQTTGCLAVPGGAGGELGFRRGCNRPR
jgi:hypothetical protein